MKGKWYQGTYMVRNRGKYVGTGNPEYKSSYEKRVMTFLDLNEKVLKWGYEVLEIPYVYKLGRSKNPHKYFVDFLCMIRENNGSVVKYAIEVKPFDQLKPPKKPKIRNSKAMKNYIYSVGTLVKNMDKWKAAEKFCKSNGIKFVVLTENSIFGKKK